MSDKDNQSIESQIQKKAFNRVRNLKYRLDKIKAAELKLKKEGEATITKEQLDAIQNKRNIVISLEESEKMCETIKETINTQLKNMKSNSKDKEENITDTPNKAKNLDNKAVKFSNEENFIVDMNSPLNLKENQDKENRLIIVEEKITEKIVQDSTLSNFFFKLLSVCRVFIRNDAPSQYTKFSNEHKKQLFDFDILYEVWRNLISFGIEDTVLSAQNRIEDQLDKCDKEGFNSLMICDQKLAKIEHELDKMIKSGFVEQAKNSILSTSVSSISIDKTEILVKENISSKDDSSIPQLKNEIEIKEDILTKECEPENNAPLINFNIDIQKATELKNTFKESGWGEYDSNKITDDDGFFVVTKSKRGGRKDNRDQDRRRGGHKNWYENNNANEENYQQNENQRRGGYKPQYNDKANRGNTSQRSNIKQP